jgi:signal transduction histidine kinase
VNGVSEDTLHGVLKAKRELLVACWTAKIRAAVVTAPLTNAELLDRIPAFVDELIAALYPDAAPLPRASAHASEHGAQRLGLRFDVAEVVREYGLLHECILELAGDSGLQISLKEQQIVLKWLNSGIADALAQYVKRRDEELERQTSEHLGFIAHELRNPLSAARAAVHRLRGNETAAASQRTVELLDRSLRRTTDMIDNALSHATLKLGVDPKMEPLALADLLRDIELDAGADAQARGVDLVVAAPGGTVVEADPRLLRSAVFNLVQNAVKFSRAGTTVTISVQTAPGAVTIEIADACGGLPPGKIDDLFSPTVQRGENRSGFGLGLGIARQAVEVHRGRIDVRDVPGTGCEFSIRLPQPDANGNLEAPPGIEADHGNENERSRD